MTKPTRTKPPLRKKDNEIGEDPIKHEEVATQIPDLARAYALHKKDKMVLNVAAHDVINCARDTLNKVKAPPFQQAFPYGFHNRTPF